MSSSEAYSYPVLYYYDDRLTCGIGEVDSGQAEHEVYQSQVETGRPPQTFRPWQKQVAIFPLAVNRRYT